MIRLILVVHGFRLRNPICILLLVFLDETNSASAPSDVKNRFYNLNTKSTHLDETGF